MMTEILRALWHIFTFGGVLFPAILVTACAAGVAAVLVGILHA